MSVLSNDVSREKELGGESPVGLGGSLLFEHKCLAEPAIVDPAVSIERWRRNNSG